MGIDPSFRMPSSGGKICENCGRQLPLTDFLKKKTILSKDQTYEWCNDCVTELLKEKDYDWETVDAICREIDIPFVPNRFEEIRKVNSIQPFILYAKLMEEEQYSDLSWKEYYDQFVKLRDAGVITSELPLLSDDERRALREKWGPAYDDEGLNYLENLHKGLLKTQNVAGALQDDQSLKLCKISYEIDERLAAGEDIDKLLTSYNKLVDIAQFTPKHAKNANDFDSIGEIFMWCEKRGWKNKYYSDVSKDVVDETMANIQSFNRKLWVNESGIGEEVQKRLELLKMVDTQEHYYDIDQINDFDIYDNEGFEGDIDNEDFIVDGGDTI